MIKVSTDLHIHTTFSDGELTPSEVAETAIKEGLSLFSITDHDTTEGVEALISDRTVIEKLGDCKFLPGVEISTKFCGMKVHMLGYDFDLCDEGLKNFLSQVRHRKESKAELVEEYLKEKGVCIDQKAFLYLKNMKNGFGKPHIIKALLSDKVCKNKEQAEALLEDYDPLIVFVDAQTAIKEIHKARGRAVLAHPVELMLKHRLKFSEITKIIEELQILGLDGVETYHSLSTKAFAVRLSAFCKDKGLFETVGSDFHGPVSKPAEKIGYTLKEENETQNKNTETKTT